MRVAAVRTGLPCEAGSLAGFGMNLQGLQLRAVEADFVDRPQISVEAIENRAASTISFQLHFSLSFRHA